MEIHTQHKEKSLSSFQAWPATSACLHPAPQTLADTTLHDQNQHTSQFFITTHHLQNIGQHHPSRLHQLKQNIFLYKLTFELAFLGLIWPVYCLHLSFCVYPSLALSLKHVHPRKTVCANPLQDIALLSNHNHRLSATATCSHLLRNKYWSLE